MKAVIETAIKRLTEKAENTQAPHDALNYAKAALNLANAYTAMAYATIEENRQREHANDNRLVPAEEKRE